MISDSRYRNNYQNSPYMNIFWNDATHSNNIGGNSKNPLQFHPNCFLYLRTVRRYMKIHLYQKEHILYTATYEVSSGYMCSKILYLWITQSVRQQVSSLLVEFFWLPIVFDSAADGSYQFFSTIVVLSLESIDWHYNISLSNSVL